MNLFIRKSAKKTWKKKKQKQPIITRENFNIPNLAGECATFLNPTVLCSDLDFRPQ